MKSNISKTLSSDVDENSHIDDKITNFFQFNEIGQIKTILREKFNLFQKRQTMFERQPLYKKKQQEKLDDFDSNFFSLQREREGTLVSNKSGAGSALDEHLSRNTNIKIKIKRASTQAPALDQLQNQNNTAQLNKMQSKIKEEEENSSDQSDSFSGDEEADDLDQSDLNSNVILSNNLSNNLTNLGPRTMNQVPRVKKQIRQVEKGEKRFYTLDTDFIDSYQMNEILLPKDILQMEAF